MQRITPAKKRFPKSTGIEQHRRLRKPPRSAGSSRSCGASQRTGWPCDASGQSTSKGFPRALGRRAQAIAAIWARAGNSGVPPRALRAGRTRRLRTWDTDAKQAGGCGGASTVRVKCYAETDHRGPADTSAGTLPVEYRGLPS